MNCIVIDDELAARAVVAKLCSKLPDIDIIQEFDNAIEAIKFLNQQKVDMIFLDLHMPGFSGIDLVQTLKNAPRIVITTSDTNFAIAAYEYPTIVDYMVKPITLERFEKSILKVKTLIRHVVLPDTMDQNWNNEQDLFINIDHRLIKLKLDEILVVAAKGDYIEVKTEKEKYRVRTTLKKIKDKLPDNIFFHIHRSYIINFTKIIDIEDNSVLIDKNVIPISRSNRPELMRRLNFL